MQGQVRRSGRGAMRSAHVKHPERVASSFRLSLHVGNMAALSPASALHSRKDEEEGQEQKAVSHGLPIRQHRLGNGLSVGYITALNEIRVLLRRTGKVDIGGRVLYYCLPWLLS